MANLINKEMKKCLNDKTFEIITEVFFNLF